MSVVETPAPAASATRRRSSAGQGRRQRWLGKSLVYLFLIVGAVITIIPFAWVIRSSLMGPAQIFISPPEWIPRPFVWENYSGAWNALPFGRYLWNTMVIEFWVCAGTVVTSAMAAFSFSRLRWPYRDLSFAVLLTSMMLPYAVTLIPTFILWQKLGAINTIAPLTVPAWFGGGAFNIFLLRQFFMTIPRDLDEAAYLDGASPLQVLVQVILPLSKPALIVVAIFTFIAVWNDFLGPLVYLNDGDKYTIAIGLASFRGLYNAQWGYLMAASAGATAPIVVLFFFAQRYFIEGISLTGIKG